MSKTNKLMEAFNLLLNEEDAAADELMHQYIVELAREINERFEDAELEEADLDYDMEDDLKDDIESDMDEIDAEEGVLEDEDDMEDGEAMDDLEGDMDMDMEMGDEGDMDMDMEMGDEDEGGLKDRVEDLEDSFEKLAAEFEELMGSEEEEHGQDFDDEDEDGELGDYDLEGEEGEFEESFELDEDEDLDEADELDENEDDEDDEDDEEELEEAVNLEKVTIPSNKEGQEVGKGGSFATNTQQITKPKGDLEKGNAKANMSQGGEAKGYKALNQQGVKKPRDMNNPDNTVSSAKSSQKKVSPEGKGDKEVGSGKGVSRNNKALVGKKVR